jgi:hypothetical protein
VKVTSATVGQVAGLSVTFPLASWQSGSTIVGSVQPRANGIFTPLELPL